jgi:hypothetical protein
MATQTPSPAMEAVAKLASYADKDWFFISTCDDSELASLTNEILEVVRVAKAVAERVVSANDARAEFRQGRVDALRNLLGMALDYQSR